MRHRPLSQSLPLVWAKEPSSPARAPAKPRPSLFLSPSSPTWLAGPASQPLSTRAKRYEWWRSWALRLRRHPPAVSFYSDSFIFQRASNNFNFLTISPNEMILFALCSLKGNLTAHQRWDFSELFRISGEFQKCSWYSLFVFKIIFRRWGLSWGSPGGLWTSSALRQATATFSWCHFNIYDFLTWMKWLIHAFK